MFPALLSSNAPTRTNVNSVMLVPKTLVGQASSASQTPSNRVSVVPSSLVTETAKLSANDIDVDSGRSSLVSLSYGVLGAAALYDSSGNQTAAEDAADTSVNDQDQTAESANSSATAQASVSADNAKQQQAQQQLESLQQRDQEVRTHEQAHAAVGGVYAGSPQFDYEHGADGKRYAVDGEVQIDVSIVPGDPIATMTKMRQVYAAAMAPQQPSLADIQVAAEAMRKYNTAREQAAALRDMESNKPITSDISANTAAKDQAAASNSADSSNADTQTSNTNNYPISIVRVMGQVHQMAPNPGTGGVSPPRNDHDLDDISLPNATLEEQIQGQLLHDHDSDNLMSLL